MQEDILYHIALHSDLRTIKSLITAHRHHRLNDYFWKNKYDDKLLRESPTISKLYKMTFKEKYMKALLLTNEIERLLKFDTYTIEIGNIHRIKKYFDHCVFFKEDNKNYRLKLIQERIVLCWKSNYNEYGCSIKMPKDIKKLLFDVLY